MRKILILISLVTMMLFLFSGCELVKEERPHHKKEHPVFDKHPGKAKGHHKHKKHRKKAHHKRRKHRKKAHHKRKKKGHPVFDKHPGKGRS